VDMAWLEKLPEEEKPANRRAPRAPPPRPAKAGKHDTIPVESEWLLPPLPKDAPTGDKPPKPPPLPSVAVKPKGRLPPPLPREDDDD
jgi:hypothetical protein